MLNQLSSGSSPAPAQTPCAGASRLQPRRRGSSPRALEARRDLLRVHDLILMGRRQCDIAAEMGKDAGWVSRTVRRINQEPALIYSPPDTRAVVSETLAGYEALMRMALEHAGKSGGTVKTGALCLAADMLGKRIAFLEKIGTFKPGDEAKKGETVELHLDDLNQDLSPAALIKILEDFKKSDDDKAAGIDPFPNLNDDRSAIPFRDRPNATRFARLSEGPGAGSANQSRTN